MRKEKLKTIEIIPIKDFKHKIRETKEHQKERISIIGNTHLYVERCRHE